MRVQGEERERLWAELKTFVPGAAVADGAADGDPAVADAALAVEAASVTE